ncbi:replicative DNA helicase [Aureimonas pseudogalii]|uniref:DNA 5'-3' helicase n=1 Tax=Aureimonas pseudogalii TaxID=1744844 RepID=A0A7W6E9K6_9HYPH|nr:DnaB-like helicase C-terminal domain-containing protein [Aureimonas pseudogalii]MBB3997238.1 replicative DNA helicase [Aureimonas pseudogalii]
MNALVTTQGADGYVPELEQSLLGVLLQGNGLARVQPYLNEQHFRAEDHRIIYRAIQDAFERSGTTDVRVVAKLLPEGFDFEFKTRHGLGIHQYLARLIGECVHTVASIDKVAKSVVEQWARLAFAEQMELASIAARDPSASVGKLIKTAGTVLEELGSGVRRSASRRSRMSAGEAGDAAIAAAREAMKNGAGLTGVTWGYADVDRITGGMQRKDLILVGARPSMGKSSVMMSTALRAARKGHGVGILSLEMDAAKLIARGLSDLTLATQNPVPYVDILQGRMDEAGLACVEAMNQRLHTYPILVEEAGGNVFDIRMKIEAMIERFERNGQPRLECLMLDHLGFIEPGAHYRGNRNNEVGEITRALKDYAKEYDIAVMLLSQLSRQLAQRDNKRPILSDLRDSGNIEQDADVVVFLHREAYYLERTEETDTEKENERIATLAACQNRLEFIIAKQRNGPVTTINLWCDMAFSAARNGERYAG